MKLNSEIIYYGPVRSTELYPPAPPPPLPVDRYVAANIHTDVGLKCTGENVTKIFFFTALGVSNAGNSRDSVQYVLRTISLYLI